MSILLNTVQQRISHLLKQAPWLFGIMHFLFRCAQARFTAGVVGVVLNKEGEILLVEHAFHPRWSWGLPGGWLEGGELPSSALRRELQEETGVQVSVVCPLLIETGYYYRSHLDIAYLCRAESDVRCLSGELLDYRWASFDALPPMLPFHEAAVRVAQSQRELEG